MAVSAPATQEMGSRPSPPLPSAITTTQCQHPPKGRHHEHRRRRRRRSSSNSGNHSNSQSHPQREQQAKVSRDFPGARAGARARVCEASRAPWPPASLHFHPPTTPRLRAPTAPLRPPANGPRRAREGVALRAGCANLDSANRALSVQWGARFAKAISNQENETGKPWWTERLDCAFDGQFV